MEPVNHTHPHAKSPVISTDLDEKSPLRFDALGISPHTLKAISALGYETPTPIQAQAIPEGLAHKDIIATAQTGTGKTAAFSIPMIAYLEKHPGNIALVLVPTRELALQIETFWRQLTKGATGLKAVSILGGAAFRPQVRDLAHHPRLIIATPGRLMDHLEQRSAHLSKVGFLVLDEADRMLDMGFMPQVSNILSHMHGHRQTLLFSATWDKSLDQLSKRFMKHPVRISAGTVSKAASTVEQTAIQVSSQKKNDLTLDEINRRKGSILIFTRTKHRTDRLARYLDEYGLEVGRLHGGRSLAQRKAALGSFRTGETRILVATDIAARGIDVAGIEHVINYDLPQAPSDYVHRIGRTGRAGQVGSALSFVAPEDRSKWKEITMLLQKTGSAEVQFLKHDDLEPTPRPQKPPPRPAREPRRDERPQPHHGDRPRFDREPRQFARRPEGRPEPGRRFDRGSRPSYGRPYHSESQDRGFSVRPHSEQKRRVEIPRVVSEFKPKAPAHGFDAPKRTQGPARDAHAGYRSDRRGPWSKSGDKSGTRSGGGPGGKRRVHFEGRR